MKIKKSFTKYEELPDTITPKDYADWRGVGENTARAIFNSKGFPRIQGTGVKQLADKRAVFLFELNVDEDDRKEIIKEMAKAIM